MLQELRWIWVLFALLVPPVLAWTGARDHSLPEPDVFFSRPSLTSDLWDPARSMFVPGPTLAAPIDRFATSVALEDGALLIVSANVAQLLQGSFKATGPFEEISEATLVSVPAGALLVSQTGELQRYHRTTNTWTTAALPDFDPSQHEVTCVGTQDDALWVMVRHVGRGSELRVYDLSNYALRTKQRLRFTAHECLSDPALLVVEGTELSDAGEPLDFTRPYRVAVERGEISLVTLPLQQSANLRRPTLGIEVHEDEYWLFDSVWVQRYQPATGALRTYLREYRDDSHTACRVSGVVWFVGGSSPSDDVMFGTTNRKPQRWLTTWDPAVNTLRRLDSLPRARARPFVTQLRDGRVLVAGGDEPATIENEAKAARRARSRWWLAGVLLALTGLWIKVPPRVGTILLAAAAGALSMLLTLLVLLGSYRISG